MCGSGSMSQKVSAGGIILDDRNRVLLVHHKIENKYDFWVLPGGRLEYNEGIFKGVEREIFEETNLKVKAEKIAYIEELMDGDIYTCKFWVVCSIRGGELSTQNKEQAEDFLIEAGFYSKEEILSMNVFPKILHNGFWLDLANNFKEIKYLGFSR